MAKTETLAPAQPAGALQGKALEDYRSTPPKDASFDQVLGTLTQSGEVVPGGDFGTGFAVLGKEDKGRLVGVPFLLLDWHFSDGDYGQMVSLRLITKAGERYVVNDGSTGIRDQMLEIAAKTDKAIFFRKGLRVSNYEYTDPKTQEKKPASTYYLDVSE